MGTTGITLEKIEHTNGAPVLTRKGRNTPHYMMSAPVMLGTWDVETVCGKALGPSTDATIAMGGDVSGTPCKRCVAAYAKLTPSAPAPAESAPEVREAAVTVERDSGPARGAARESVSSSSSLSPSPAPAVVADETARLAERAQAVREYYAAGNPVPPEVASLPDPHVSWTGSGTVLDLHTLVCEYKGAPADGSDADGIAGQCPECRGILGLSDKGAIGRHNVYGVPTRATKGALKSKSLPVVEHGSTPGDPAEAAKRRAREAYCAKSGKALAGAEGGTAPCPTCERPVELKARAGKKGTTWVIPNHVRPDGVRPAGAAMERGYVGRDRVISFAGTAGAAQRDHGSVDGSAYTGQGNMPPVQPADGTWLGKAGTGILSMTVRPGIDGGVEGRWCALCGDTYDRAHAGMSRSWRRKHCRRMAAYVTERAAERGMCKAREIQKGEAIPQTERAERRKAVKVGSMAAGTNGSTGVVTHTPAIGPDSVVFPDAALILTPADAVEMRDWTAVPVPLRDHAHAVLPKGVRGEWRTVGEFRENGKFVTVAARRVPGGAVLYGITDAC